MSAASRLAWFSMAVTSSALAAPAVRPATRSSSLLRSASFWSSSAARRSRSCLRAARAWARSSIRLTSSSSRCSRSARRSSRRSRSPRSSRTSSLTARISSSTSRRPWAACSASSRARSRMPAASVSARARMWSASWLAFSSWTGSWAGVRPGVAVVPAPDDDQREHHREQPDHHERERQSAAHGHPFPSIALGAPLCCNFRFRGLCPGAGSRTRRRARRLFSGPAFWLPYVSGCFSSADALLVRPDFPCRVGQHLAAVRLRLDNLFIKQRNADRRERCVSWMKGALTRGRSGWSRAWWL